MTDLLRSKDLPEEYAPERSPIGGSPILWMRGRRENRAQRRVEAQKQRVEHRVELLGPQWHVVDPKPEDLDFIAIGPGGIFSVTVCDHGRSKVLLAGEVVQIDGKRPPYVATARREAAQASEALTRAAGRRIPVIPMLAFLGSGEIVYYGKPPEGCILTSWRDVGRALDAHGKRISQETIDKLATLATRPDTWMNHRYPDASSYRWYPEDAKAADKNAGRR